jgi:hypothetical protein
MAAKAGLQERRVSRNRAAGRRSPVRARARLPHRGTGRGQLRTRDRAPALFRSRAGALLRSHPAPSARGFGCPHRLGPGFRHRRAPRLPGCRDPCRAHTSSGAAAASDAAAASGCSGAAHPIRGSPAVVKLDKTVNFERRPRLLGEGAPDTIRGLPHRGAVAQLGEHHVRNVGVEGSNPFCSTKSLTWPEVPSKFLKNGQVRGVRNSSPSKLRPSWKNSFFSRCR